MRGPRVPSLVGVWFLGLCWNKHFQEPPHENEVGNRLHLSGVTFLGFPGSVSLNPVLEKWRLWVQQSWKQGQCPCCMRPRSASGEMQPQCRWGGSHVAVSQVGKCTACRARSWVRCKQQEREPTAHRSPPLSRSLNIRVLHLGSAHASSGHWLALGCDWQISAFSRLPDLAGPASVFQDLPPAMFRDNKQRVLTVASWQSCRNDMPTLSSLLSCQ